MKSTISSLLIASLLSPMAQAKTILDPVHPSESKGLDLNLNLSPYIKDVTNTAEMQAQRVKEEAITMASLAYHASLLQSLKLAQIHHKEPSGATLVLLSSEVALSLGLIASIAFHDLKSIPEELSEAYTKSIIKSYEIIRKLDEKWLTLEETLFKQQATLSAMRAALAMAKVPVTKENMNLIGARELERKIKSLNRQILFNSLRKNSESTDLQILKLGYSGFRVLALRTISISAKSVALYLIGYEAVLKGHFTLTDEELQKSIIDLTEKVQADKEALTILNKLSQIKE